jgi:hypothetical protein
VNTGESPKTWNTALVFQICKKSFNLAAMSIAAKEPVEQKGKELVD